MLEKNNLSEEKVSMAKNEVQAAAEDFQASRRDFMKRAAYVAPAILTLAVAPSYAKAGSEKADGLRDRWESWQDWLEWWWRNRT
jgi:hypothetical protein